MSTTTTRSLLQSTRFPSRILCLTVVALLAGCGGEQSVLNANGDEALSIRNIAYVLFAGGALILLLIVGLTLAAVSAPEQTRALLSGDRAIFIGGVVFPAIVLTALLIYGVSATARVADPNLSPLRISVEGKQWWWRIRYGADDVPAFESANEIRIPVDRPVEFSVTTGDVIHSFWVPRLAGKLDMIPGRTTKLLVTARQAGEMRGQCAEFCGGPHGLMSLRVVAMAPKAFAQWLAERSEKRRSAASPGHRLFIAAGCGGCHAIDGTDAKGTIGPNLTDIGARKAIAAETLPMSRENLSRWIAHTQTIKPENLMPQFTHLSSDELGALSVYLEGLK